jgi:hypothetical protein
MKLNNPKQEISTYDNLTNSLHYPSNRKMNQQFINDGYDNYPLTFTQQQTPIGNLFQFINITSPLFCLELPLNTKRSQSIHLKTPLTFQMTTNDNHHHRTKDSFSHNPQQTPNILRHISTPSLELFHNNQTNSINFTRSTFGRNNIRKKQPRTNPNYVNIQIKTDDGSLRSTYIRLDNTPKCQTLTFSSSSSPSNSSSEQDSIRCNSQSCLNKSNNETIVNQKSSLSNIERSDNTHTLTNKTGVIKNQFVTCTDGKNRFRTEKKKCFLFLEFLFHSTTDPLNLNFQQIKMIDNGKYLNDLMHS